MAIWFHRLFQKHNILPKEFDEMDEYHKALIIASEEIAIEEEEKAIKKAKKKRR
ncbi:hypothetical protein [Clostridium sp. HMP27]|uniref:hypothetical protein n=1 Tax=Clostridium sp. HMP27 TaxID=1487921 RepID=UPI000A5B9AC2|nr:hypothetical protein [Clostridium sp. HMP27]